MALDTTADNLMREVLASQDATADFLHDLVDRVQRMLGPGVRIPGMVGLTTGGELQSGHTRQAVRLKLPRSVQRSPKTRARSRRGPAFQPVAEALAAALTTLSREDRDEIALRDLWMDYYFGFGVARVSLVERAPDRFVPGLEIIDPMRFSWDTRAQSVRDARHMEHRWTIDYDDLLEQAQAENDGMEEGEHGRWDLDAIKAMEPGTPTAKGGRTHPDRREVEGYEVWVPEIQLDPAFGPREGYNGTLYTLARGPTLSDGTGKPGAVAGVYLREPRPYAGPRTGPYVFAACWPVPRSMFPLSPQQASDYDEQQLDRHLSAAARAMLEYKRVTIVPKGMGNQYQGLPSGFVLEVAGLDPRTFTPVTVELGGITPQHLEHLAVLRDHLARSSGLDATQQGAPRPDITATASAIADQVTDTVSGFEADQFLSAVREIQQHRAHHAIMNGRVRIPIDDPDTGLAGEFFGGADEPDDLEDDREAVMGFGEPADLVDALEIDIETHSMERTGQTLHLNRLLQMNQFILSAAPMVRQLPEVAWDVIFKTMANELNTPELAEPVNLQMAYMLAGIEGAPAAHEPARFAPDAAGGRRALAEAPKTVKPTRGPEAGAMAAAGAFA